MTRWFLVNMTMEKPLTTLRENRLKSSSLFIIISFYSEIEIHKKHSNKCCCTTFSKNVLNINKCCCTTSSKMCRIAINVVVWPPRNACKGTTINVVWFLPQFLCTRTATHCTDYLEIWTSLFFFPTRTTFATQFEYLIGVIIRASRSFCNSLCMTGATFGFMRWWHCPIGLDSFLNEIAWLILLRSKFFNSSYDYANTLLYSGTNISNILCSSQVQPWAILMVLEDSLEPTFTKTFFLQHSYLSIYIADFLHSATMKSLTLGALAEFDPFYLPNFTPLQPLNLWSFFNFGFFFSIFENLPQILDRTEILPIFSFLYRLPY